MEKLIILLADVSGSMSSSASNTDEGKIFSRLDFVKQSSLFTLKIIDDNTIFSVVTFSDNGNIIIPPTKKGNNISSIETAIGNMRTEGGTSIVSGLSLCKSLSETYVENDITIILLSDGEDYNLNEHNCDLTMNNIFGNESRIKIDTIGFGPEANTKLLVKIAQYNAGSYSLCYDASMVGTIIGRAIARIYLGSTAFGIENTNDSHYIFYNEIRIKLAQILLSPNIMIAHNMNKLLEITEYTKNYLELNQNNITDCLTYLMNTYVDMTGELYMACSTIEYWNKWGKAYWTTMGIALDKQYAPNFKDISLQHFGNDDARNMYKHFSEKYNEMNMVTPTLLMRYNNRMVTNSISASTFNNVNSGCFHMDTVLYSNNKPITANDIIKMLQNNERVFLKGYHDGNDVKVEVETIITNAYDTMSFRKVNNCILTEHHPILYNGVWEYPKTISKHVINEEKQGYVFNLILKKVENIRYQAIYANDEICVCLGHGINDQSIATDPFWGTEKVVNKYHEQFQNAKVIDCKQKLIRSVETGFTIDMIFE